MGIDGAWEPGGRVGDFEVLRKLGAGGMGVVFEIRHVESGQHYAVKTLPVIEEPEQVERFKREAQAQAALDHPNVVRIHSFGKAAGRLFLVQDLAAGGDLESRIRESGALTAQRTATIVRDLACGLHHVHQAGVLHRDLKPSNVLFNERGVPQLVDFGIAKVAWAGTMTASNVVLGTPAFMAPEQVIGDREKLSARTDVYGLGAVLYHCLAGGPPFSGPLFRVMDAVTRQGPPALSSEVPRSIRAICAKAMAREPVDRYSTAGEFASALDAFLREESSALRSGLVLGVLAAAVVIGLVAIVSLRGRPSASRPAVEAPASLSPAETGPTRSPKSPSGKRLYLLTRRPQPLAKPGTWVTARWSGNEQFLTATREGMRVWLRGRLTHTSLLAGKLGRYREQHQKPGATLFPIVTLHAVKHGYLVGGRNYPLTFVAGFVWREHWTNQLKLFPTVGAFAPDGVSYLCYDAVSRTCYQSTNGQTLELTPLRIPRITGQIVVDVAFSPKGESGFLAVNRPRWSVGGVERMKRGELVKLRRQDGLWVLAGTTGKAHGVRSLLFHPSDRLVVGTDMGTTHWADPGTLELSPRPITNSEHEGKLARVHDLRSLENGRVLLVLSGHETSSQLELWDCESGKRLAHTKVPGRAVYADVSPDETHALLTTNSGVVELVRLSEP